MEGSSNTTHTSHPLSSNDPSALKADKAEKEALPKQSEETQESGLIGSNWPLLPSESGSPIPSGQKSNPASPSP